MNDAAASEMGNDEETGVDPIAPVSRRMVAWITDLVVTVAVAQTIAGVLGLVIPLDSAGAFTVVLFFGLAVAFSYWGFATPLFGNTLGKWALGIQIRGYRGKTPRARQWVGRMMLIALWPINAVMMIASDDNRHLGDKLADTQVVTVTERSFPMGLVLAVVLIVVSFNLGGAGLRVASVRMAPYEAATKQLEARGLEPGLLPKGFRVVNDSAMFDFDVGDGYRRVTLQRTSAGWEVDEVVPIDSPSTGATVSFGPANASAGM